MPANKRPRRERTDDWQKIEQYTLGRSRKSTSYCALSSCSMSRRRNEQEKQELPNDQYAARPGNLKNTAWQACLSKSPKRTQRINRGAFHQICVNLLLISKRSILAFAPMKWQRSVSCVLAEDPHPHTIQRVLADGPFPRVSTRGFLLMHRSDRYQSDGHYRILHAEDGPSPRSRLSCKPLDTVYEVLKRLATEGHAGLDDKSRAPHHPARKVTMRDINEVKKLASNPDLGAYRVRAALEQMEIQLSQATCGRLLALNRKLYGLDLSKRGEPRRRKCHSRPPFAITIGQSMSDTSKSIALQASKDPFI